MNSMKHIKPTKPIVRVMAAFLSICLMFPTSLVVNATSVGIESAVISAIEDEIKAKLQSPSSESIDISNFNLGGYSTENIEAENLLRQKFGENLAPLLNGVVLVKQGALAASSNYFVAAYNDPETPAEIDKVILMAVNPGGNSVDVSWNFQGSTLKPSSVTKTTYSLNVETKSNVNESQKIELVPGQNDEVLDTPPINTDETESNPDTDKPIDETESNPDTDKPIDETESNPDTDKPIDETESNPDTDKPIGETNTDMTINAVSEEAETPEQVTVSEQTQSTEIVVAKLSSKIDYMDAVVGDTPPTDSADNTTPPVQTVDVSISVGESSNLSDDEITAIGSSGFYSSLAPDSIQVMEINLGESTATGDTQDPIEMANRLFNPDTYDTSRENANEREITLSTDISLGEVKTGESFNYELTVVAKSAAPVKYGVSDSYPLYSLCKDNTIYLEVPSGIIIDDTSATLESLGGEEEGKKVYSIKIKDLDLGVNGNGTSETININAHMSDNGKVSNGTDFPILDAYLTTTFAVDVRDMASEATPKPVKDTKDYKITTYSDFPISGGLTRNLPLIKNTAESEWKVEKSIVQNNETTENYTAVGDTVQIDYIIKVGLNDGTGKPTNNVDTYDVFGRLFMKEDNYSLTDTLPVFTGSKGEEVKPLSATMKLGADELSAYKGDGEAILTTNKISAYSGKTNNLPNGGDAGYTEYAVSVTYPKEAFMSAIGAEQKYKLTNKAELKYKLLDDVDKQENSEVSTEIGFKTDTSGLKITKKIVTNSAADLIYTPETAKLFPGGVSFGIQRETSSGVWGTEETLTINYDESGNPIMTDNPAGVTVDPETGSISYPSLRVGKYKITEKTVPTKTTKAPDQTVTVKANEITEVVFKNTRTEGGISIEKLGQKDGKKPEPMKDVVFTLYKEEACTTEVTKLTIDADGKATAYVESGTYWLKETTTPAGFIPAAVQKIIVKAGTLTTLKPIINKASTSSITVTKKTDDKADIPMDDRKGFKFALYNSTKSDLNGKKLTDVGKDVILFKDNLVLLEGSSSFTVADLAVTNADGNVLYYYVAETASHENYEKLDTLTVITGLKAGEKGTATIVNKKMLTLSLQKKTRTPNLAQNALNGTDTVTANAKFKLWKMNTESKLIPATDKLGVELVNYTTDSNGMIKTGSLPQGIYYWQEVEVNENTLLSGTTEIKAATGEEIKVLKAETSKVTSALNIYQKADILIVKRNSVGGAPLKGAEFKIEGRKDKNLSSKVEVEFTVTTGDKGEIRQEGVDPTLFYTITETKAPPNFSITDTKDPQKLTPGITNRYTFTNTPWPKLTVEKTWASGSEKINGAVFTLYVKNNSTFEKYQVDNKDVTFTIANGASTPVQVEPNKEYWLQETKIPDGAIDPAKQPTLPEGAEKDDNGKVYYKVAALTTNTTKTITNLKNESGSVEVTKKDALTGGVLKGAEFTIDSEPMKTVTSGDNGIARFEGLPIYDNSGNLIQYTIKETKAPEAYTLSTKELKTYLKPGETVRGNTDSGLTKVAQEALVIEDFPLGSISVTKKLVSGWNGFPKKFAGVQLALYEKAENGYVLVAETNAPKTTGENGVAEFTKLDTSKSYIVAEVSSNGASLPAGKILVADESGNALVTITGVGNYNAIEFTQENWKADGTDRKLEGELKNHDSWVQVKIKKVEKDANPEKLLNFAQFQLYRTKEKVTENSTIAGFEAESLTLMNDTSNNTERAYYETGTSVGENGERKEGEALTGKLEDGYAYWLLETKAPGGYTKTDKPILLVPETFSGTTPEGATPVKYKTNAVAEVKVENTKATGGSGGGPDGGTYAPFQVKLTKWLKENAAATEKKQLPSIKFKIWLTDKDHNKIGENPLTIMETGLNDKGGKTESGIALSNSIDLSALYEQYNKEGMVNPITYVAKDEIKKGTLTGYFMLEEFDVPAGVTMDKSQYFFEVVRTDGAKENQIHDYGDIYNYMDSMYPISVYKYGYQRADGLNVADLELNGKVTSKTPLAGVQLSVYKDGKLYTDPKGNKVNLTTDGLGNATMRLPAGDYKLLETDIGSNTKHENVHATWETGVPFTVVETINTPVYVFNPEKPNVKITKTGPAGAKLAGVQFTLTHTNPETTHTITLDSNGVGTAENVSTGSYTVTESFLPDGSGMTNKYFAVMYPDAKITVGWDGDKWAQNNTFEASYINPGTGSLVIKKTNEKDEPLAGATFNLYYQPFTASELGKLSTLEKPEKDELKWLLATKSTPESSGELTVDNLQAGWYRVDEKSAPPGYAKQTKGTLVKLTVDGVGGVSSPEVIVKNFAYGNLTLTKNLSGDAETMPGSITFDVFVKNSKNAYEPFKDNNRDAHNSDKKDPVVITVPISEKTGTVTTNIPAGTYYLKETVPTDWLQGAVTGGDLQADGYIKVEVETGGISATNLTVENIYTKAKLSIEKVNETRTKLQGAEFKAYYKNAENKIYLNDGAKLTTDANGEASMDVDVASEMLKNMPEAGYGIYLEEVKTPDGYEKPRTDFGPYDWNLKSPLNLTGEKALINKEELRINLTKTNAVTGSTIQNVEFSIYEMQTSTPQLVTNAKTSAEGKIVFANLSRSEDIQYSLSEAQVDGYGGIEKITADGIDLEKQVIGEKTYYLLPKDQLTDGTSEVLVSNKPVGSVTVIKQDYANKGAVEGAEFILYKCDDEAGTNPVKVGEAVKTDGNGKAVFEKLEAAWYKIEETAAAPEYVLLKDDPRTPITQMILLDLKNAENGTQNVESKPFFNIKKDEAPTISKKTLDPTVLESLFSSDQTAEFELSGFASGENNLPIDSFILEDSSFTMHSEEAGLEDSYANNQYSILTLSIGSASFKEYNVDGITTQTVDATAKVTAIGFDGAEIGSTTTLPLKETNTSVVLSSIAGNTKVKGIKIEYLNPTSGKPIGPGFTATPVTLSVKFLKQKGDSKKQEITKVENKATVLVKYFGETATKSADAVSTVTFAKQKVLMPHVSILKEVSPKPEEKISVGTQLEYTITLKNNEEPSSKAVMVDPIIVDALPKAFALLETNPYTVEKIPESLTQGEFRVAVNKENSEQKYAYLDFKGNLEPGESIVLKLKGTVLPEERATGESIINNAYATSLKRLEPSSTNESGSSFYSGSDLSSNSYGIVAPEGMEIAVAPLGKTNYRYVSAEVQNIVSASQQVQLYKYGKGSGGYVMDASNILVQPSGELYYKLIFRNSSKEGSRSLSKIRIMDTLPILNDQTLGGHARGSEWEPVLEQIESVNLVSGGSETPITNYTPYYSSEKTDGKETYQLLLAATKNQKEDTIPSPGWSTESTTATRSIMIDIPAPTELKAGDQIEIVVKTKVPEAKDIDMSKLSFRLAINDCNAGYAEKISKGNEVSYTQKTPINSTQVKALFQPGSAKMGDYVWIDENYDGLQNDSGATLAGVKFRLYSSKNGGTETEVDKEQTTGSDGLYLFDGLTPAIPDPNKTKDLYGSNGVDQSKLLGSDRITYRAEVDIPEGYIVTKPYSGNNNTSPAASGAEDTGNRLIDSNFKLKSGNTYQSERFFIPPGKNGDAGFDLSIDLGLTKVRNLNLQKLNAEGGAIPGTVLAIHGPFFGNEAQNANLTDENFVATLTTDKKGEAKFISTTDDYLLAYASYIIRETQAAPGYTVDGATVSHNGGKAEIADIKTGFILKPNADTSSPTEDTLTVTNVRNSGALYITKTNELGTMNLKGAVFSLTMNSLDVGSTQQDGVWDDFLKTTNAEKKDGVEVKEKVLLLTTDKDGKISLKNLPYGKYSLQETVAPAGYALDETVHSIEIDANSEITKTITNKMLVGNFKLKKVSTEGDKAPLQGAEFTLSRKSADVNFIAWDMYVKSIDGNAGVKALSSALKLVTDENGEVNLEGIPLGEYILRETKAPEGFEIVQETWAVTIKEVGAELSITAENKPVSGNMDIKKVSSEDEKLTLAGAEFKLSWVGEASKLWDKYLTSLIGKTNVTVKDGEIFVTTEGKEGTASITGLPLGTYKLEETKAPEGYELNTTPQTVQITEKGVTVMVSVKNTPTPTKPTPPTPEPDPDPTPPTPEPDPDPTPPTPEPDPDPTPPTPEPDPDPTPPTENPPPEIISPEPETTTRDDFGEDTIPVRTPVRTPTPRNTVPINDEPVPLAALPPVQGLTTIDDEEVPLGSLPRTGGFPVSILSILGAALFGAGWMLQRKKKQS